MPQTKSSDLASKHPQWDRQNKRWMLMDVAYEGEDVVKAAETTYLPATSGMENDDMGTGKPGKKRYDAYLQRAVFPDLVSDAVSAMVGVMHRKPPVFEVPKALEPMLEEFSNEGETAELFLRRINEGQLVSGRLGLLLDMPETPDPSKPQLYVAMYGALAVINWDKGRRDKDGIFETQLVVLDESEQIRTDSFSWEENESYRVLSINETVDTEDKETKGPKAYHVGVFTEGGNGTGFVQSDMIAPTLRGQTLEQIPFVFVNSKDNLPDTDKPPLLGLADLAMTIYRGEADYRHALFMQGQDTLVRIGWMDPGDDEEDGNRAGAGAVIDVQQGGDAKYIGTNSQGIPEMRMALENDKKAGANKAGQMLDTTSRAKESGDALKVRIAAQTATLVSVALSGAAAMERILKIAAEWQGLNADEVSVVPNLDFADDELIGKAVVDWMTAKTLGAPISNKTIHALMKKHEITELDYEAELEEIEDEVPLVVGTDAGLNEDGQTEEEAAAAASEAEAAAAAAADET